MKELSKFILKDSETISTEEMKIVRGGVIPRDLSFYECFVDGSIVPNEGMKCIYARPSKNTIIVGTCRKGEETIFENGIRRDIITAYCEMD